MIDYIVIFGVCEYLFNRLKVLVIYENVLFSLC